MDLVTNDFIKRYGQKVEIIDSKRTLPEETKAIIQPFRKSTENLYAYGVDDPGDENEQYFLYVGMIKDELDETDQATVIKIDGKQLKLVKAEKIGFADKLILVKGLLKQI